MLNNQNFINLVKSKKFEYLGMGNPDSDILIIGQEHAVDLVKQADRARIEVDENRAEWEEILNGGSGERYFVEKYKGKSIHYYFTPATGYQYSNVEGGTRLSFEHGTFKVRGTWPNYKKMLDGMLGQQTEAFDIFDRCFMSELSAICAVSNRDTDRDTTKKSVDSRKGLWVDPFFQGFKTVIIAAGRYDDKYQIDFFSLFPKAEKVIITPQLGSEQYVSISTIVAFYKLFPDRIIDLRRSIAVKKDEQLISVSDGNGTYYCIKN